jgi:DNA-binding transcriptional ArsR family regulator
MEKLIDLVLHPIRMRIIIALAGREMTAQQLAEMLGDVPPATLYRHLNRLTKAGVLMLVAERQVRGTLEKVYTLSRQYMNLGEEEFAGLSREDHLRYFTTFIATLLDDFSRYVNNAESFNLRADGVGYQKILLELSDEELAGLAKGISSAVIPYLNNQAAPGRKRRIFATIFMPDMGNDSPQDTPAADDQGTPNESDKELE